MFYKKVLEIDLFNKDARQFLDKLEQKKGSPVDESVESPEVIYNKIQQICTQEEPDVMIKEIAQS